MGIFITFEGVEGCGKTFQSHAIYKKLCRVGMPAVLTWEPGGTPLGNKIRRLLKGKSHDSISPISELFLFAASRFHLVQEVILPSLQQGMVVICDRFADSTMAYQGYGRGIDLETIESIREMVCGTLKPDLTILLDFPPTAGLARKQSDKDRFELENIAFHKRVRAAYRKMAKSEPERWMVIDAGLSRIKISNLIWQRVTNLISRNTGTLI